MVDWRKIGSGPTFNALVSAILLQNDRETYIFNRDGRDGAIDALSGDKKTVYQSKYHGTGTSAQAFSDANKELKKIKKYQSTAHKWHAIWNDVGTWCLVTNVKFGPQDELRWDKEVRPKFGALGITPTYQTSAHLDNELIKHRDIAAAFLVTALDYLSRSRSTGNPFLAERSSSVLMTCPSRDATQSWP